MFLNEYNVVTTNHETFTGQETAKLYALIYKRFGYDRAATVAAVSRLMQSGSADDQRFADQVIALATYGLTLLKGGK